MTFPTKTNSQSWYSTVYNSQITSYASYIGIALLAGVAAWYGYKRFDTSREAVAQEAYVRAQELYTTTVNSPTPDFQRLNAVLQDTYHDYKNRSVAPYLLNLQADSALQQNDLEKALNSMAQALYDLSAHSPLYSLYTVKYALMLIDTQNQEKVAQGLSMLEQVANNKQLHNWDQAAYYRGLYYRTQGDMMTAVAAWDDLINMPTDIQNGTSSWAALVQATLQKI